MLLAVYCCCCVFAAAFVAAVFVYTATTGTSRCGCSYFLFFSLHLFSLAFLDLLPSTTIVVVVLRYVQQSLPLLPPPQYGTCLAFFSREGFSPSSLVDSRLIVLYASPAIGALDGWCHLIDKTLHASYQVGRFEPMTSTLC